MREYYEEEWKIFLKCSKCGDFKEANINWFDSTKEWMFGCKSWCKECTKKYNKNRYNSNSEKIKKNTNKYYHTHKDLYLDYYKTHSKQIKARVKKRKHDNSERVKQYRLENRERFANARLESWINKVKWIENYKKHKLKILERKKELKKERGYSSIHTKTNRAIKKLWIRPKKCPICWRETRIESHHPDYTKWYEVVFCCNSCHQRIHNKWFECPQDVVRLI